MKKIIYLISITFLILQSCSSGNESNPVVEIPDLIKPPYTVKYEIIFPQNIPTYMGRTTTVHCSYENNNGIWLIATAPGTNFYINGNNHNQGFTKTFTVTTDTNPLSLDLCTTYNPIISSPITLKIYVNNIVVKQSTEIRQPYTGYDSFSGISYSVY